MNFQTLLPLFAIDTLLLNADGYGALFAAMGVGTLIGSLSLAFVADRRPVLVMILGGGLGFVGLEALLGLSRTPLAAFPVIVVLGLCSMLMVNSINVMVQHRVPDELRGRVMALYVTVFAGSTPIGGLLAGGISQAWGAPAALLIGAGLASLVLALVAWQLVVRGKAWAEPTASPMRAGT
jgi:predicted MFS family arabinose efflux permease